MIADAPGDFSGWAQENEDYYMRINENPHAAWVLMAIVFGAGEKQASLDSIISAADYVNHAIIKYDEINEGIIFLLRKEIISREEAGYKLSKQVMKRYNSIKSNSVGKYWKVTEDIIMESESRQDVPLPLLSQEIKKIDYEKTIHNYLERNKVE